MRILSNKLRKYLKKRIGLTLKNFTYFNSKVYFPTNSLIFKIACKEGIYDKEILDFIFTFLTEEGLFIDVGTNIGLLSVPVLNNFKNVEVLSFEPSASILPFLLKTHHNSIHKNRWFIKDFALGACVGEVLFQRHTKVDNAFDSIKGKETLSKSDENYELVSVHTLDNYLNFHKREYNSVVIKIDVEGFEYNVLKGGQNFITKYKPFIVIEIVKEYLDKYDITIRNFLDLSKEIDYNIYGLSTLNKISNVYELQIALKRNLNFILLPNITKLIPSK